MHFPTDLRRMEIPKSLLPLSEFPAGKFSRRITFYTGAESDQGHS